VQGLEEENRRKSKKIEENRRKSKNGQGSSTTYGLMVRNTMASSSMTRSRDGVLALESGGQKNQGTEGCYTNESCLKARARCSCEYKRKEWA
jgi:hypothetical protein